MPQPCSATQSHSRHFCAHPASWVSVPPFPGALLPRGKGSVTQQGEQSTHRRAERAVPAPWGTLAGKRHSKVPLKTPSSRPPCPQCLWWCSCDTQGVVADIPVGAASTWVPREVLGVLGKLWGAPGNREVHGSGAFIGLEVGEVSAGTAWGDTGVTVGVLSGMQGGSAGFRGAQWDAVG